MIKNLRKRFTVVAMSSMFIVLATVMAIFNILNYVRIVNDADNTLRMIAENDGKFPSPPSAQRKPEGAAEEPGAMEKPEAPGQMQKPDGGGQGDAGEQNEMSPEAPFSTRYFSVTLDSKGSVQSVDLDNIAAVSEEEADDYAGQVFSDGKKEGFWGNYRYKSVENDGKTTIIFLDCHEELKTFFTNLWTSLAISAAGLVAVFVLVIIFSGIVFRPVAEGYEKQKQFITDAGHEIKTPLTIIDANVEVIEMLHGADEWTKSVRKQVRRLTDLTRQLVTLTKLEEQKDGKRRSEFSLTEAVRESIEPFAVFAKTSGRTIETSLQENVVFAGDEKSIRQLVGILLDNAVKYSLADSVIQISLAKKGKRICLEVYNETENISGENLDLIFERFYRMDASRNSETGGSGIGLSVARAIVETHHGKIQAQSDDGRSLRIRVVF